MAIQSLRQYQSLAAWQALGITPFPDPPGTRSTPTVNQDSNKMRILPAGWVGTNLLAFSIVPQTNANTVMTLKDANANILKATVSTGTNPTLLTTYWTVDMGTGASGQLWQLNFQIEDGNTDEGTWVFAKGSGDDDLVSY